MASGHANRANRPNTWLHRPATRREVLTCQPGAVHTWHLADVPLALTNVCFEGNNGHDAVVTRCLLMTHNGHSTRGPTATQQSASGVGYARCLLAVVESKVAVAN
jgi:hypothetical protein